ETPGLSRAGSLILSGSLSLPHHPVAPRALCPIQRLVRGADHQGRPDQRVVALRGTDAHRDGQRLLRVPGRANPRSDLPSLGPVSSAHGYFIVLDVLAQFFEVRPGLFERSIGKNHAKFLAAVAIRLAAPLDPGEARRRQPENLVSDVVTVGVVELL